MLMQALLTAGFAERDITPSVGVEMTGFAARKGASSGIRDPLVARALALSSRRHTAVLVGIDIFALSRDSVARIRAQTKSLVPAASLLLSASHTHAGPATVALRDMGRPNPGYRARVEAAVIEAIDAAIQSVAPAVVAVGAATATTTGLNRRLQTETGIHLAPNPAGPFDPAVDVLRVANLDGEPVAVWFTHAVHPTVLPEQNTEISAEWPGEACRAATTALACPCLFAQGCCGDVNPRPPGTVEEIGEAVADAVEVACTLSRPLDAEIGSSPLERVSLPTVQDAPDPSDPVELEIQALRLGDLAIIALNAEPFVGIGTAISAASPFRTTIVLGYTNGCFGYLPDRLAFCEPSGKRGYEVDVAPWYYGTGCLTTEAPVIAVESAKRVLRRLAA